MDSLISAGARALACGDPLGALQHVALRDDPPALALRGIAMAQLGDYPRARALLRRASRGFGAHEDLARARCVVAEAEVALAMRDLSGSTRALSGALNQLDARSDHANAVHARLIITRRALLLGRLDEAAAALAPLDASRLPPALAAVSYLATAELALRSLRVEEARTALACAAHAAGHAQIPALLAEVQEARAALDRPVARLLNDGACQPVRADQVSALFKSDTLVLDACRRGLNCGTHWQALASRPVLFTLAQLLAEAWPKDVEREDLTAAAFRLREPDDSLRARLRVEIGRLRALIEPLAGIEASVRGFVLKPHGNRQVAVLAPPIEGEQAALVALLADGAAWSTSALALALGASQRTVQRALAQLEAAGTVRAIGQGRSRRWLAPPLIQFATVLLLPAALPIG